MTQERELLLKDLCARLPHGIKVAYLYWDEDKGERVVPMRVYSINTDCYMRLIGSVDEGGGHVEITKYLPYLRPMSSMTKEEKEEFRQTFDYIESVRGVEINHEIRPTYETYDWLNAHHFDYRGLIKKGLALEAPEDMYKNI